MSRTSTRPSASTPSWWSAGPRRFGSQLRPAGLNHRRGPRQLGRPPLAEPGLGSPSCRQTTRSPSRCTTSPAVQGADVVDFDYADGPNGVRGHHGATAFPSMLALAASFDRRLAAEYGVALAHEVLAAGRNADLLPGPGRGPGAVGRPRRATAQRGPVPGRRDGRCDGEAVQSQGVLAVATHYVANNFEWLRTGEGSLPRRTPAIDSASPRALHEIYLEPFRRALAGTASPASWVPTTG